jgi:hypothetical protein
LTNEMSTPYIQTLLQPRPTKATDRKSWSIPIFKTWVPFFHATNVAGETHIASEALGAPLRLAIGSDGAVKFSKSGRPVVKVVKELSDQVRLVRENFQASLEGYASTVAEQMPDEYKASYDKATKKGEKVYAREEKLLGEVLASTPAQERELVPA